MSTIKARLTKAKAAAAVLISDCYNYKPIDIVDPSTFGEVFATLHDFRTRLKKSKQAISKIHDEWEQEVDKCKNDDEKHDKISKELDDELLDSEGIRAYYTEIDKMLQYIDDQQQNILNDRNNVLTNKTSSPTPTSNAANGFKSSSATPVSNVNTAMVLMTEPQITPQEIKLDNSGVIYTNAPNVHYDTIMTSPIQGGNTYGFQPYQQHASQQAFNNLQFGRNTDSYFPHMAANVPPTLPPQFNVHPKRGMALRELQLPKFGGDPLEFRNFWQGYMSVHDDPTIPINDKLTHLLESLTGEAKEEVSGFQICNENYMPIIQTLHEAYGQPDLILDALYLKMEKLQCVNGTLEEVKEMVSKMEAVIRQLYSMNGYVDENMIKHKYAAKLPDWFLRGVYSLGLPSTLAEFSYGVRVQLIVERKLKSGKIVEPQQSVTITEITGQNNNQRKPGNKRKNCFFCGQSHASSNCTTVTTIGEREKFIREKNRCIRCLKEGHETSTCVFKKPCYKCSMQHNTVLCPNKTQHEAKVHAINITSKLNENLMPVKMAPVVNFINKAQQEAAILIDTAATATFILQSLADDLQLPILKNVELNIRRFNDKDKQNHQSKVSSAIVEFKIKCIDNTYFNVQAYTIQHLTDVLPALTKENIKEFVKPQVLIGNNYCWEILKQNKRPDGYCQVASLLGDITCGTADVYAIDVSETVEQREQMQDGISKFWSVEAIEGDSPYSEDDQRALEAFAKSVELVDGRIQVRLPFKESPNMGSNKSKAIACLKSQLNTLVKKPDLFKCYDEIIKEQLVNGMIEEVVNASMEQAVYIPHHAVVTPGKSTPLRIVYNCSSKEKESGKSLNDFLLIGPSLIPNLMELLLRIRMKPILVSADVKKAFLQLSLHPDDRDYVRFVWIQNPEDILNKGFNNEQVVEYRFSRVLFGCSASPFLLNAANQMLFNTIEDVEFQAELKRDTYVDNTFIGADTIDEAITKTRIAIDTYKAVNMDLRQVNSNESAVNDEFDTPQLIQSILGYKWDPTTDELILDFSTDMPLHDKVTKRMVSSICGKKFDPLGFLNPVTVKLKKFLQTLWKAGESWDSVLDEHLYNEFQIVASAEMKTIVPRYVGAVSSSTHYDLHLFADASGDAYCCAAYLVVPGSSSQLLISKTKLSPVRPVTIPRLELLAAHLASKLLKMIMKSLPHINFGRIVLWTDSSAVLCWLNLDKKWKRFIQNRVHEIKEKISVIKYVPTSENPADLGTRGVTSEELNNSDLWWHGPAWITDNEDEWPKQLDHLIPPTDKDFQEVLDVHHVEVTEDPQPLIDTVKNNTWFRLVKIVAAIKSFTRKCKGKSDDDYKSVSNIKDAEKTLLKMIQSQNPPSPDSARNLSMYVDTDGLIRCRSRIQNELDMANPIYLPFSNESKLLIIHIHHQKHHGSARDILVELRQRYWMPKGLMHIKKSINSCWTCKKLKAKPYCLPHMPDLPEQRITPSKPFTCIGIDAAGPYLVKTPTETKRWILLITCLATRAVVLETLYDMSGVSVLNALRRFIGCYGLPSYIFSDQGTNFILCSKIVSTWIHDTPALNQYLTENKIEWKHNTERASWKCGVIEILVKLMKESLKYSLGRKILPEEEFTTLLKETMGIMNSRPITDVNGVDKPLRPIDFFMPNCNLLIPQEAVDIEELDDPSYIDKKTSKDNLREQLTRTSSYLSKLWTRFQREYLTGLRDLSKRYHRQHGVPMEPTVNDVVLINDENVPKGSWKLGIVEEVHRNPHDNAIRSVKVATTTGPPEYKPAKLTRSPAHLYPLEGNFHIKSLLPKFSSTMLTIMTILCICNITSAQPVVESLQCKNDLLEARLFNVSTVVLTINNKMKIINEPGNYLNVSIPHYVHDITVTLSLYFQHKILKTKVTCPGKGLCSANTSSPINVRCYQWYTWCIVLAVLLLAIFLFKVIRVKYCGSTWRFSSRGGGSENAYRPSISYIRRTAKLTMVIVLINSVNACQNAVTLPTTRENCERDSQGFISCRYTSTTLMNIQSGTESCLLLKTHTGMAMGTISMETSIHAKCIKNTIRRTKLGDIKVESVRRCGSMGSCQNNKCSSLLPSDVVPELAKYQVHPGYVVCSEACNTITCGCFTFGTGCLFSYIYAEPQPEEMEVFQCSSWNPEIIVNAQINNHNISVILSEEHAIKVHNVSFYLKSIKRKLFNELLIEKLHFINFNQSVAFIDDQALKETEIITCSTNKCKLRQDICICRNADSTLSCSCPTQIHIKNQLRSNQLPTVLQNHHLLLHDQLPTIQFVTELELIIETQDLLISQVYENPLCSAKAKKVIGHYGPDGAPLIINCETTYGEIIAHLECMNQQFALKCNKQNPINEKTYHSSTLKIDETCTLSCGQHNSQVHIIGQLEFIDDSHHFQQVHGSRESTWNVKVTLSNLFEFFYEKIFILLVIIIIIAILLFLIK